MAVKLKGKQWFAIYPPKYFGDGEIGKTISAIPESLVGKTINISAVDLTNDINKYYIKFKLKINSVNNDKAFTQFQSFECLQDYISRMVLRRIRRIDSVQSLKTSDDVKIRVKGMTIVSKRVNSSVARKIREFILDSLKKEVESGSLEEFLHRMLSNEIKNKIMKLGRTIYPLRNFEIRKVQVIQ